MKNFKLLIVTLMTLCFSITYTSCSEAEETTPEPEVIAENNEDDNTIVEDNEEVIEEETTDTTEEEVTETIDDSTEGETENTTEEGGEMTENNPEEETEDPIDQEEDCKSCEIKPADDEDFRAALIDSKLQTEFLTSDNKDLANFCDGNFFYLCDDLMIFEVTGIKDERNELRQEQSLALNDFSNMEYEATFENVPTSSSSKGVTIAQIHNDFKDVGRPLIRVDIIGGNLVRSHINQSFVKNDGSASNDDLVSFTDGDLLYVKLEISDANDEVSVYVENKTSGASNSIKYTVNSQWDAANGEYYYKAGLYSQEPGFPIGKFSYLNYSY